MYKWWAFAAIAVGLFTSVADNGSVIVALPTVSEYFDTDLPTTQWVFLSYALTVSALLMPMGRLSDVLGRKQVYVAGFITFVAGAVLSGLATNILVLIGSRVIMGLGAAMTQGTSMAMIVAAFPHTERGKALGLQMSVVGIGGVAGPAVGGLIIGAFGWRGVFFATASLGALSIVVAQLLLEGGRTEQEGRGAAFDWLGAATSTVVMLMLLLSISYGPKQGWASPPIVAGILAGVILVGVFIWWELRTRSPMLDVRLFKRRLFTFGVTAGFISFIGMSSVRFLMPFYLQAVLGYSPRDVGLIIVPSAVAIILMGPVGGRLSDRYGWRIFNVGGLTVSATGLALLSRLETGSPMVHAIAGMVLVSCGAGLFNAANNSSVLSAVEQSKYGIVSGFLNLVRNSANVTGIAMVTAIVTATMASQGFEPSLAEVSDTGDAGLLAAFTSGLRTAYLVITGLITVGVVLSFFKGAQILEPEGEADSPNTDRPLSH